MIRGVCPRLYSPVRGRHNSQLTSCRRRGVELRHRKCISRLRRRAQFTSAADALARVMQADRRAASRAAEVSRTKTMAGGVRIGSHALTWVQTKNDVREAASTSSSASVRMELTSPQYTTEDSQRPDRYKKMVEDGCRCSNLTVPNAYDCTTSSPTLRHSRRLFDYPHQ